MIKVILVGSGAKKIEFLEEARGKKDNAPTIGIDFETIGDFQVWDLRGLDRMQIGLKSVIKNADAIIYLNADEKLKAIYENNRDKENCIVIDYASENLSAKECLESIKYGKERAKVMNDKNYTSVEETATLVIAASKSDKTSHLYDVFPKEITNEVVSRLYSLFQSPQKPIKQEEQTQESNNCSIQ